MWPEVFHHGFLVSQHIVHVHRNSLRGTAENDHRTRLSRTFLAAPGRLQKRPGPEERNAFARNVKLTRFVGRLDIGYRHPANQLNDIGWDTECEFTGAQHDHLRHRRRERQNHAKGRTGARLTMGLDATAQSLNLGTHHVHPDSAAGQFCDFACRGEARHEDQVGSFFVAGIRR